ncbi:cell wall hydrolase [Thermaerobacillus caldiproteolyticus]|uniref:N-acetylmuramoyl-L-alanine amidase n=1 Tax=Thermaerobacillus caldiproteolyticus TaxID=247480 RepID=A0A7V9Z5E2_9BACL|nr:cell wall hydrolase [Anoxybacillus caldiproteolyticus]MBA2874230.1 N-acetylmuramoyl-L-alanine amidase [Anoxybacillus caldiproteolyticus]QPA31836.1 cell wall hydrolase [Anoxybacillus caldiproteolyticus]
MKKLKKLALTSACFAAFFFAKEASASTIHEVKRGESLWTISKHYGVSVIELKKQNKKRDSFIFPGEKLVIPSTISPSEKDLLARLVHAEAKGEPFAGKVAVATVVLNRVDHPDFPDTIREVIYERSGGHYAFTPVQNGAINEPADRESYRAVEEALAFRGLGNGSLFFYNPKTAKSNWLRSKPVTVVIGNHVFAK